MLQEQSLPPSVDLLESMRSVGYSFESSIADLIDNSITAGARNIDIDIEPTEAKHIYVIDDGAGMLPDKALEALRLAGSVGERSRADLGRFGLGLKTASLSQARCLTLITKRHGVITGLRWDIDHIRVTGNWSLLKLSEMEMEQVPGAKKLLNRDIGTLVSWERLDLFLGDAPDHGAHARSQVGPLIDSLSLTFHRYLARRKERVWITVNSQPITPIDPFLSSNSHTQSKRPETLKVGGEKVAVTAHILPHASDLTPDERQRNDLGPGMRDAQGFYIYRNERLISHGQWYGLARMDEFSKQTRIQVDVPNTIDHLWHLDIKKSRAEPPASFKSDLKRILVRVLDQGKRVYTFRGRKKAQQQSVHLWVKVQEREGIRYEINRDHPLVSTAIAQLGSTEADVLNRLLDSLANTFPAQDLFVEMAGNVNVVRAEQPSEAAVEQLRQIRDGGIRDLEGKKMSSESATRLLAHVEPFNAIENLSSLVEQIWSEENHVAK